DDDLPDLLIVDGGRGQLGVARRALDDLGLADDLALAGLAKGRLRGVGDARTRTAERLFVPGSKDPIPLPEGAPETLLVAHLRDEAHRFAISYHRTVRGSHRSALDRIDGIGPERRRRLLRTFGSLTGVREASLDDLYAVPGLPKAVARRVYASLREGREGRQGGQGRQAETAKNAKVTPRRQDRTGNRTANRNRNRNG
ncbi:helix-hairpin-helix domain-containing protein, partial [Pontiella sp.]|uniref:helix-hairpin-helix domain-containing protein n=1 Tax=Pontiella sp. TaxID=2837462 RepID=UPI00356A2473